MSSYVQRLYIYSTFLRIKKKKREPKKQERGKNKNQRLGKKADMMKPSTLRQGNSTDRKERWLVYTKKGLQDGILEITWWSKRREKAI